MSADKLTDAQINALISKSEVHEYHPGAILEFAREVIAAHQAQPPQEPVAWLYGEWWQDQGEGGNTGWFPTASTYKPEESERIKNVQPLYASPQPAHVQGWQLVPVEPTTEMMEAAKACSLPSPLKAAWARMLAAAPQQGDKTP